MEQIDQRHIFWCWSLVLNVGQFGQWTIWPGQFGLGQFGLGQFGHQKILDRTTGPDEYNVMGFDFLMTFGGEID